MTPDYSTQITEATAIDIEETQGMVQRVLIDFDLADEFQSRLARERRACLRWISASVDNRDEEERIGRMLDTLYYGRPLPSGDTPRGPHLMTKGHPPP